MQSLRRFASPRPSEGVAVIVRPQALARLPRAGGPQLSNAAGQLLRQIRVSDEYGDEHAIQVPVERPLSVLVDGRPVATLWTLGACPEWLVWDTCGTNSSSPTSRAWSRSLSTGKRRPHKCTLFGHAAPGRYIGYAGGERFDALPSGSP